MTDPFRLAVLTALWGRPAVSGAVLAHLTSLDIGPTAAHPGVTVAPVAVRSPEDPDPVPDVPGVVYAEAPNAPLSDKWNAGAAAVPQDVDAVMVLGSDDLVSAGYVAEACARVRAGADLVTMREAWFVEPSTRRALRVRPTRMGAGRVLSARLLRRLEWRPWPPGLDRRLDGGMDARIGMGCRTVRLSASRDRVLVDVKTDVNMWGLDAMARYAVAAPPWPEVRALFRTHFPVALPLLDMATKKKTTTKADAPEADAPEAKATTKAKAETVSLRALKNIRPERAGTDARVWRGDVFETSAETGRALKRDRLAADADAPANKGTKRTHPNSGTAAGA